MKRQILLGLGLLMIAGSSLAYEGTKTAYDQYRNVACTKAAGKIPYDAEQIGGCYCEEPENEGGQWMCNVDYRKESSSSGSSSSSSSSYSSGSSSYSSPSYTPSYGSSSGRFTPTPVPQRNPYVLSGQR